MKLFQVSVYLWGRCQYEQNLSFLKKSFVVLFYLSDFDTAVAHDEADLLKVFGEICS